MKSEKGKVKFTNQQIDSLTGVEAYSSSNRIFVNYQLSINHGNNQGRHHHRRYQRHWP